MSDITDKTLSYYNTKSDLFAGSTVDLEFSTVQDLFLKYLEPGALILDFGCGSGRDSRYFIQKGYNVEAIDGSEEMVRIAAQTAGIPVKQMLFNELDETEKYDGIFACASILHVPYKELADVLERMKRAVKKNGYLYVSFKYGDFEGYRNDRYFTDLNEERFQTLLDEVKGLTIIVNSLKPEEYIEIPYDIPRPTEKEIRDELEIEAKEKVTGSIFSVGKLRKQYVDDNLENRLKEAIEIWEEDKSEYNEDQEAEKREMELDFKEQYEAEKAFLTSLIEGDKEAVSEVFDEWISQCELPVEINISYEWQSELSTMLLDVDLPEIENINTIKMIKTDNGSLKEKKKTQTEIREEYATLVFGLAIFISSHTFNISPAVKKIMISGYTQRRNKNGDLNDDYIYSLKFTRDQFENRDLSLISPKGFCSSGSNRFNMTSTSLFKTIIPYDSFD